MSFEANDWRPLPICSSFATVLSYAHSHEARRGIFRFPRLARAEGESRRVAQLFVVFGNDRFVHPRARVPELVRMITNRLQLALERLQPSDWHRFEKLASAFLASEFDDLRTTASPSGDQGRDSELFTPTAEPKVLLQYSVSADWARKIQHTVRRIQETFPGAIVLVFVSNQVIGAAADPIRRKVRQDHGLSLDVRDRSWFVERVLGSPAREKAAEELAQAIVDPFLASAGVSSYAPSNLSSPEAIAAITFLGLQWRDDVREKGLTKLAFEALVRAVLANTDSEHRMARASVRDGVCRLLPGHSHPQVHGFVDSALRRLTKRAIRHWQKQDEFCLTHEEKLRVNDFKTQAALGETELLASISAISTAILSTREVSDTQGAALTRCIRAATDAVLLERSQAFAIAVQTGSLSALAEADFSEVLLAEASKASLPKIQGVDWLDVLKAGVREVLLSEEPAIQAHMRSLADAYTLLAFLRQTPDVQGAVEKMFSHGQVWLDASVILPLLAEPLADGPSGRFTRMFEAARDAGLELFVTPGAIEEIERHMNRALTCARMDHGHWLGPVPYLLERYVASGRSLAAFHNWLETFRGDVRPEQDIGDYLQDQFGIATRSLEAERDAAPPELRHALQALWHDAHRRRRERQAVPLDEMVITRLVEHDVECYCGVTQLRTRERASPFGYSAWWLTVDRQAFDLKPRLRNAMAAEPPDSPVLSADFMVNYLAFGPVRRKVGKAKEAHLPLMMELGTAGYLTPELLAEAEKLRQELKELPDRVVRRRIRDHLDRARRRLGPIAKAGVGDLDDELVG